MSYEEVESIIRGLYSHSSTPLSVLRVKERVNATQQVIENALERLCKKGFCKRIKRGEYIVISSSP